VFGSWVMGSFFGYIIQKWGQNLGGKRFLVSAFSPKNQQDLLDPPKYSCIWALLYSKELALQHGFNEAIDKLIRICGAEIYSKTCVK
jgi:hypothetical protein